MIRQYTIGIPGIGMKFDAEDVHRFVKEKSAVVVNKYQEVKKASMPFALRAVLPMAEATCSVLEVIANSTADAHDELYKKIVEWQKKGEQ